jgi:hypothetical protein
MMVVVRRTCLRVGLCALLVGCSLMLAVQTVPAQETATGSTANKKAKQQISQLKKLKLIEALDLDNATAEKFFLIYNSEQKKVDEARKVLDDAMQDLDKAKDAGNSDKIKQLNEQTLVKHEQFQKASSDLLRSVRGVLNEKQYAEYLVFESRFQDQLRKTLMDIKREAKRDSTKK